MRGFLVQSEADIIARSDAPAAQSSKWFAPLGAKTLSIPFSPVGTNSRLSVSLVKCFESLICSFSVPLYNDSEPGSPSWVSALHRQLKESALNVTRKRSAWSGTCHRSPILRTSVVKFWDARTCTSRAARCHGRGSATSVVNCTAAQSRRRLCLASRCYFVSHRESDCEAGPRESRVPRSRETAGDNCPCNEDVLLPVIGDHVQRTIAGDV